MDDNENVMDEGMFFYVDEDAEQYNEVEEWLDEVTWEMGSIVGGVKVG